jgi:hypothetical protein
VLSMGSFRLDISVENSDSLLIKLSVNSGLGRTFMWIKPNEFMFLFGC